MFKNILVPTDGSEFSKSTVQRAVSFAKEAKACITAFNVKPPRTEYYWAKGAYVHLPEDDDLERAKEEEAQEILGFVEKLCKDAGVKCTKVTQSSDVIYEAIINAALQNDCDLIFMASHGRRGIKALILGSETHKVLTHSTIPVLVYR